MHVSSSAKFWDNLNAQFFAKYSGINECHDKWADLVVHGCPIEGPLGRSWTIPMRRHEQTGELKIPWTTLSNYPVQGTGADIMMFARIMAYKRIKKLGIPVKWVSTVHDSIVVETPPEYVQQVVDIFHQVFADLPKTIKGTFGYDWIVPMDCECKQGMNMKDWTKILPSGS
jgi:DNA polymerase I-like protein with 3'-5' exonuclease and polymerase domains